MSNDIDRRKDMVAAAAVAMARNNVAKAAMMFGERQPAAPAVAPAAAPAPVKASNDALFTEAARRRAEREAAEAADTKAAWSRVIARASGKPVKSEKALDPANPWSRVVAAMNARNGKSPAETRATRSGWAAVIADFNARRGR